VRRIQGQPSGRHGLRGAPGSALSRLAREAVIAAITTDAAAPVEHGPVAAAVALRAVLPEADALTAAEHGLLGEWLDRITDPA
jgi:hypothetical protein